MKIKYYGNSCFLFKAKGTKLITNPKDSSVKVNLKRIGPDIVAITHKMNIDENKYYLISSPGEYEVKDVFVYGYLSDLNGGKGTKEVGLKSTTLLADIYMFDVEDIHLSIIDKGVKKVRKAVLDEMGIVNVLFVSLDQKDGMKLKKIVDLVNEIEPQIVVPMDYTKELLDNFVKVMGVKEVEKLKVLDIKSNDFSDEELPMRIVFIEK